MDNYLIKLSKEVKLGLKNNKPIVALESTFHLVSLNSINVGNDKI